MKMTVGQLKEELDNFGDHLQVIIGWGTDGGVRSAGEAEEFTVEAATDKDGVACCVLESD